MTEWIGAAEAAGRLGIKPASLYAYVSRGVLGRRRDPGGRGSLFDADEVAKLAQKGRPRRNPAGAELMISSAVTEITGSRLRYRGHDAIALARQGRSFEDVAGLLWTGKLDGELPGAGGWQATQAALAAGSAAQAALPAQTLPLERLQVIVPALAATDPLRLQLERPAVIAAAPPLIAGMIGCLPHTPAHAPASEPAAHADGHQESIAVRLSRALRPGPPPDSPTSDSLTSDSLTSDSPTSDGVTSDGLTSAVRTALVLAADHELAASTLAARVAASVRADPYAVVATGLGAVGGALHGGAALGAEVMLGSADSPADAARVVGDLLRRGERIPGFGHFVYKSGDPRAILLLEVIAQYAPDSPRLAVARAVLAEARRRALPEPNIDFALATLTVVAGLVPGAGEAIFAVARTAGWIAHALEEYAAKAPIRPRGVYTGPAPQP